MSASSFFLSTTMPSCILRRKKGKIDDTTWPTSYSFISTYSKTIRRSIDSYWAMLLFRKYFPFLSLVLCHRNYVNKWNSTKFSSPNNPGLNWWALIATAPKKVKRLSELQCTGLLLAPDFPHIILPCFWLAASLLRRRPDWLKYNISFYNVCHHYAAVIPAYYYIRRPPHTSDTASVQPALRNWPKNKVYYIFFFLPSFALCIMARDHSGSTCRGSGGVLYALVYIR